MPEAKIKDFLLKPGALHAQEFFDVGYTVDDVERLNRDIDRHFDIGFAFDKVSFSDGREKFSIFMNLGVTNRGVFELYGKRIRRKKSRVLLPRTGSDSNVRFVQRGKNQAQWHSWDNR